MIIIDTSSNNWFRFAFCEDLGNFPHREYDLEGKPIGTPFVDCCTTIISHLEDFLKLSKVPAVHDSDKCLDDLLKLYKDPAHASVKYLVEPVDPPPPESC